MQVKRVQIKNFGPYYGEQEALLAPGSSRVTLIHGDNMRGKTSLLNALRWCLYGSVRSRTGSRMPMVQLLNSDAKNEGVFAFSVELEVEDAGRKYIITRQAESGREPTRDQDFKSNLHVRRDGHFLPGDAAQIEIKRLLPEEVSHFFLFDGEMLNDFENLLADSSDQAKTIRNSIEQILGVPAIEHGIVDIELLLKEARRRRDREAQTVKSAQRTAERAEEVDSEITVVNDDIAEIEASVSETKEKVAAIDKALREFQGAQKDADHLDAERQAARGIAKRIGDLQEERKGSMTSAWMDVLVSAVAEPLAAAEEERDKLYQRLTEQTSTAERRSQIEKALSGPEEPCPTCAQAIGANERKALQEILDAIPNVEPVSTDEISRLSTRISRLKKPKLTGVADRVSSIESEIRKLQVEHTKVHNRITELETKLREHDLTAVSQLQRDRERHLKHEGALNQSLDERRTVLAALNNEAKRLSQQLSQVKDPHLTRLNREVELLEALLATFQGALDELRDDLKDVIEEEASRIFLQLTTDKSYKGLEITDSYGLFILDANGDRVFVRSAGAEQVVALSLIGALNRNAVKRGPIIMDTPFGRLDPKHRKQILEFLPEMAEQVALLVHGGEVDRDRDLAVIAGQIQREYELQYVSSARTSIIPVGV